MVSCLVRYSLFHSNKTIFSRGTIQRDLHEGHVLFILYIIRFTFPRFIWWETINHTSSCVRPATGDAPGTAILCLFSFYCLFFNYVIAVQIHLMTLYAEDTKSSRAPVNYPFLLCLIYLESVHFNSLLNIWNITAKQ